MDDSSAWDMQGNKPGGIQSFRLDTSLSFKTRPEHLPQNLRDTLAPPL